MDIFVYSDESGVFDRKHERYFVFGGIMFLSRAERDVCSRKYAHAEKVIRERQSLTSDEEVKASRVTNANKGKLFRSLNNQIRFGVVIDTQKVITNLWGSKKDKQRYLDYAYKIAVKRCFSSLIKKGKIVPEEVRHLYFFVDEHTTATNGRYELREALEQEFKFGTYNLNWNYFYPPIFPNTMSVTLEYCNSANKMMVRAADVIANRIFHLAYNDSNFVSNKDDFFVTRLP